MIKTLRLVNFRNHADTVVPLEKVNIFVGSNGAGKTSIQAAIEMLLTGKCQWTDRKGSGADELIRHGEKKAIIEGEIAGIGKATRTIPGGLKVENWSGNSTLQQKTLYEQLNTSERVINAVLNTSSFIDMDGKEQKDMLFNLMGLEFNKQKIRQLLSGYLGKKDGVELNIFNRHCPNNLSGGAEVFDELDKQFREYRRIAKKDLKDLEVKLKYAEEKASQPLPEGITIADRDAVTKQLKKLEEELHDLSNVIATEELKQEQRKIHSSRISRLNALMEQLLEGQPVDGEEDEEKLKKCEAEIEKVDAELAELSKSIGQAKAEISGLNDIIAPLENFSGECPLAPGTLECSHTKEDIKNILITFAAKKDKREKDLKKIRSKYDKLQDTLTKLQAEKRSLQEAVNRIKNYNEQLEEADKMRTGYLAEKAETEETLKRLGEPVDLEETQQKEAQLRERIAKGKNILEALNSKKQDAEEQEKVAKEYSAKEEEVEALESMVKAFSPDGIKQNILKEIVLPVQNKADEKLKQLTGGELSITFEVEKDFEIKIHKGNTTTKLQNLSTGERLRTGIVLQDVLNSLSRLGIMIIDNTEHLDPLNRVALTNMLLGLEDYETIIVLATMGERQPVDPGIPGLAVYLVENGRIKRATEAT